MILSKTPLFGTYIQTSQFLSISNFRGVRVQIGADPLGRPTSYYRFSITLRVGETPFSTSHYSLSMRMLLIYELLAQTTPVLLLE